MGDITIDIASLQPLTREVVVQRAPKLLSHDGRNILREDNAQPVVFHAHESGAERMEPAEFLVTGPDGKIVRRTILGDRLLVDPEKAGQEEDSKRVFYFDLPLRPVGVGARE